MKKALDTESIRKQLKSLISNFESELDKNDLRNKVLALVPIFHSIRDLGKSLILTSDAASARTRILFYFRKYPKIVINGDELLVVSAIQEYARRVRELRVQFGWSIINGITAKEMAAEDGFPLQHIDVSKMKPDDYILLSEIEDRDAAHRWNIANEIRKRKDAVRIKILDYLKHNVGKAVTGEELRYVAGNKTEWARRVRELRTEFGWSIVTKNTGRPDLPIGTYILESLRQSHEHDRQIPDPVRGSVLRRDNYKCVKCGWSQNAWNPSDPRHLELHHEKEHAKGGENTEDNLVTVCTICHDEIHRKK
ncbi:MAG: HNH endonuclease [Candidatus Delongbacteria bacterium]|nr:HNH endonuclease [Candidatus Delongbacteria bacterium]